MNEWIGEVSTFGRDIWMEYHQVMIQRMDGDIGDFGRIYYIIQANMKRQQRLSFYKDTRY